MKPVMYIFLNRGLGMTEGKIGAQCGHATSRAEAKSHPKIHSEWKKAKHETKLVMLAEDEQHMLIIERYINDRGFKTELVIDEGRTEVRPHTITAMGVEVVDKDDPDVQATFGDFKVYKAKKEPKKTPWYSRKGK